MSIHRRWVFIGFSVAAVIAVGVAMSSNLMQTSSANFLTATVTVGNLDQTVTALGRLQPKELVNVGAQVTGQVQRLHVVLGQKVKAGDLIAEIDAKPQQLALRNAEASVASLQAQKAARQATLVQAQLTYNRQKTLIAVDATARADVEAARAARDVVRAEINSLQAQIDQARIQVETARIKLAYARITAPMDGVVVAVVTKQGQTLNSFQSAPTIVVIAKLNVMTVRAKIAEADVNKIHPGQSVWFTTLGQKHRYQAHIEQVEPAPKSIVKGETSTAQAIYYNALFDVPNPKGVLKPSMTAQVSVLVARERGVVLIPIAALGERIDDGYRVRVVNPETHQVVSRQVKIGITTTNQAVVISGVKPGEQVVLGEAGSESNSSANLMGI
ncbi:efflux RND transporter periplasmic adaptor subunit [Marinomonas spartinae]|uniref:efflux RND transporter periplasmic adaptor subunit n=1 Tax=Marinomonas spartinae TaxID=1792290 RepID=UPI0018F1E4A2|nr:efflux RND transporter periplasmic adaptor subunit [Marinomonas spartinae]MBJ7554373.1 efflux RND transporter periplasmic adaptor subunit [Marinomonas spartinae]